MTGGSPPRVRRGYVDGPDGQIHYRYRVPADREDAPVLVMLHQTPSSSVMYERAIAQLGDHVCAYAPDTPGYGQSDPPPEPLSIPAYADRIIDFLDALGIERCCLLGQHTGGFIAVEVASRMPERVDSLILTGVGCYSEEERARRRGTYAPPLTIQDDGSHLQWMWQRYRRMLGPTAPTALIQRCILLMQTAGERYHWAYEAVWDYDIEPRLRALRQPVLLLCGEHDPVYAMNPVLASILPNASVETIANAGAFLPDEHTEQYVAAILKFLRDRRASVSAAGDAASHV